MKCLECPHLDDTQWPYYCEYHHCEIYIAPPDRDKEHYLCQTQSHVSDVITLTTGMMAVEIVGGKPSCPGNHVFDIFFSELVEVTVIRISPEQLVAIPYDHARNRWTDDPRKILDVRIQGPVRMTGKP